MRGDDRGCEGSARSSEEQRGAARSLTLPRELSSCVVRRSTSSVPLSRASQPPQPTAPPCATGVEQLGTLSTGLPQGRTSDR